MNRSRAACTTRRLGPRIAMLALVALVGATACDCDSGTDRGDGSDTEAADRGDAGDASSESEPTHAFGLPLPPEYEAIRLTDHRARVATNMEMDELEEFFRGEVVDYEVVRTDRGLRLVPLRTQLAQLEAYYFAGEDSHVVVIYRPGHSPEEVPFEGPDSIREASSGAEDSGEAQPGDEEGGGFDPGAVATGGTGGGSTPLHLRGRSPEWLSDVQGQPVELKTPDGRDLAPGARWGEPYTPPEGSPLDRHRHRHNFGEPFGDWRPR